MNLSRLLSTPALARARRLRGPVVAAMVTVAALTLVNAVAGALRDVVIAGTFGAGAELDAFLVAFVLPSFALSVVAGSLTAAFLPTYVRVREHQGDAAAQRLFASTVVATTVLLTVVAAVLFVAGYRLLPRLASAFTPAQIALSRALFLILVPAVVIKGMSTIWGAVLNANRRFALVAATPALAPGCAIVFLLLSVRRLGVFALAVGIVAGYALEAVVLGRGLRRHGIGLKPAWHGISPELRQVARQYAPTIASGVMMSSTTLVDQTMAASLPAGSVSMLNFGSKLVALVCTVGSMALGTVLLPVYSELVARDDWAGVRAILRRYGTVVVLSTLPLVACLAAFREPIVALVFQRGAFSHEDTMHVATVQLFAALQIPFYLLATLTVRLISSLRANEILMWGAILNFFVNIGLNYAFMREWGVAGIALSTSLVYLVSFCFVASMLMLRTHGLRGPVVRFRGQVGVPEAP